MTHGEMLYESLAEAISDYDSSIGRGVWESQNQGIYHAAARLYNIKLAAAGVIDFKAKDDYER